MRRWRDDDDRDSEVNVRASKRRRASPPIEDRPSRLPPVREPSESPPPFIREPLIHRYRFVVYVCRLVYGLHIVSVCSYAN